MKQKDIAVIVVVAFISAIVSFFISNKLFVTPANRQQQVQVVDPINANFQKPDNYYFNSSSINPAVGNQVTSNDDASNQNPFDGGQ